MRIIVVLGLLSFVLSGNRAFAQDSETLYNQKCANCHAKDGSGRTAAASKMEVPDFRSKRIKEMSDTDIYNSIAHGTRHRDYPHAFLHTGMTEEQIKGIVKYVRSLGSTGQSATPRGPGKS